MKTLGKILKGGVLAAFMAVMFVSPAFAACQAADLERYGLSTTQNSPDYPVKCTGTHDLGLNGGQKSTVYGKDAASCAALGAIDANPGGWCQSKDLTATVRAIINTIILVVGMLAVVMIIIGGINYALSQGDPGKVKKAKDTILYGIVGLVVFLLAFAIVQFVLQAIATS